MKRVPAMIVTFFLLLFAADGFLLWLALTHQDVVVDSYRNEHR